MAPSLAAWRGSELFDRVALEDPAVEGRIAHRLNVMAISAGSFRYFMMFLSTVVINTVVAVLLLAVSLVTIAGCRCGAANAVGAGPGCGSDSDVTPFMVL